MRWRFKFERRHGSKKPPRLIRRYPDLKAAAVRIEPHDVSLLLQRGRVYFAEVISGDKVLLEDFTAVLQLHHEKHRCHSTPRGVCTLPSGIMRRPLRTLTPRSTSTRRLLPCAHYGRKVMRACASTSGRKKTTPRQSTAIPKYCCRRGEGLFVTALKMGKFDLAAEAFSGFEELNGQRANLFAHRGRCRNASKDFDGALADFEEVISSFPKSPSGYHGRAMCRVAQHQFALAMTDFDTAVKFDPKFVLGYANRGDCWSYLYPTGKGDRWIIRRAIQLQPELLRRVERASSVWFEMEEYDQGRRLRTLPSAIRRNPDTQVVALLHATPTFIPVSGTPRILDKAAADLQARGKSTQRTLGHWLALATTALSSTDYDEAIDNLYEGRSGRSRGPEPRHHEVGLRPGDGKGGTSKGDCRPSRIAADQSERRPGISRPYLRLGNFRRIRVSRWRTHSNIRGLLPGTMYRP